VAGRALGVVAIDQRADADDANGNRDSAAAGSSADAGAATPANTAASSIQRAHGDIAAAGTCADTAGRATGARAAPRPATAAVARHDEPRPHASPWTEAESVADDNSNGDRARGAAADRHAGAAAVAARAFANDDDACTGDSKGAARPGDAEAGTDDDTRDRVEGDDRSAAATGSAAGHTAGDGTAASGAAA
jgi:hypothetical protein